MTLVLGLFPQGAAQGHISAECRNKCRNPTGGRAQLLLLADRDRRVCVFTRQA